MRTLGIVGGIGPESTIDYYRTIIGTWRQRYPDAPYPRLLINSIDLKTMLEFVSEGDVAGLTSYLSSELERLVAAGAEIALFASNTPHLVIEELRHRTPIPLISIVDATCQAAQVRGSARLGLLGTRFTMQSRFYADEFAKQGMTVISPDPEEQATVHAIYMTELVPGVFKTESRAVILQIIAAMRLRDGVDAVILGGTELPLLLRGVEVPHIVLLDTATIHAHEAVKQIAGPW